MIDPDFVQIGTLSEETDLENTHRSFLGNVVESFKRGEAHNVAALGIYDALEEGEDTADALKTFYDLQEKREIDPIQGNFLINLIYKGANTAGQMIEGIKKGGIWSAVGAAGGAAVGGVAGALFPTVGEEPFLVGGGAKIGAKLAGGEALGMYFYRTSRGALYADLLKEGVDDEIARGPVNQMASILTTITEMVGIGFLAAPFKKIFTEPAKKLMTKGIKGAALRAAGTYGKTLAAETTQEGVQEVIQFMAEDVAKYMDGQGFATEGMADYLTTRGTRVLETISEAAQSFALIPVPGAVVQGGVGLALHRASLPLSDRLIENAVKQIEESSLSNEDKVLALSQIKELSKEQIKEQIKSGNPEAIEALEKEYPGTVPTPPGEIRAFHGTRKPFGEFKKEYSYDSSNLYGPGFYFTNDPKVASGYAGRDRGANIRPVNLKLKKTFDVNKDTLNPRDVKSSIERVFRKINNQSIPAEEKLTAKEQKSVNEVLDKFGVKIVDKLKLSFEDVKKSIVETKRLMNIGADATFINKSTNLANLVLQELGFDSLTHVGGELSDGVRHKVWVVFSPENVSFIFTKLDPNIEIKKAPIQSAVEKVRELSDKFVSLHKIQKKKIKKKVGKRVAEARERLKVGDKPFVAYNDAVKAMSGKLKEAEFIPFMEEGMTQEEADSLGNTLRSTNLLNDFEKLSAFKGLQNLLFGEEGVGGVLPEPKQMEHLGRVFGSDFMKSLIDLRRSVKGVSRWDYIKDAINISRTLMVSGDLSGAGRQGIMVAPLVPVQWAKGAIAGVRSFNSPKYAQLRETLRKTHPLYKKLREMGLKESAVGGLEAGEEYFNNNIADRVPFVKGSERAFVTTLNEIRWNGAFALLERRPNLKDADVKWLSDFLNHATGHGSIKGLEKLMSSMSTFMFAPRLLLGRFQAVGDLMKINSPFRAYMAARMVGSVAGTIGLLGLLNNIQGVEVEDDPRSTDFGRVKIGQTRIDVWAGYQPIARTMAQMITGEKKSTASGRVVKQEWNKTLTKFLQSKLSPVAGIITSALSGKTFRGEKVDYSEAGLSEEFINNFVPLFVQDVTDAIRFQGLSTGALAAPLAVSGVGVATYETRTGDSLRRARNVVGNRIFGKDWDTLGPAQIELLEKNEPVLAALQNRMDYEREDYDFIGNIAEQQSQSAKRIRKLLPKKVQNRLDSLEIKMPGLSRTIGPGWYLDDKKYKEYQDLTLKGLSKVLPGMLENSTFRNLPITIQQEMVGKVMRKISTMARKILMDKANYKSLIDYQEIKRRM